MTIGASTDASAATHRIYAKFTEAPQYTLTFNANGGTINGSANMSLSARETVRNQGVSFSLPTQTPVKAQTEDANNYYTYQFAGWYTTLTNQTTPVQWPMTGVKASSSVYAKWNMTTTAKSTEPVTPITPEPIVDPRAEYKTAFDNATGRVGPEKRYTKDSWEDYQAAVEYFLAVYESQGSSEQALENALEAVKESISKLVIEKPQKNNTFLIIGIIAGLGAMGCAAGLGVYFWKRKRASAEV
jgi:uncharacterized repeat protein (TIGR02543 family)